ncbi:MAG: winged helix-turn-helix domain-containing protein [Anaerolineales bacterium]|nr:winged helix-turn-helix domain-containing protein [Anaerolineales bacterium]QYK51152.1 MAG: winged helix-turn-helix domain-containing protein [Anaerolineales bacterium]
MKQREYRLLEAIAEDETITQAGLASRLGMAIGSVNWYIKRLISRGYLKATRMDRTRLRYNLTGEGMRAFQRNATQYVKDSLKVYHGLREQAKDLIASMQAKGIESVYIDGSDPELDIFRLSCLETGGLALDEQPGKYIIRMRDGAYSLERSKPAGNGARKIA